MTTTSHGAALAWRKSTRSASADECVELAARAAVGSPDPVVFVRDSKAPGGAVFCFGGAEFAAFLARVKRGELDL
ncbi:MULTISPECIES: DUF397 domain-containing protein [unclassified Actinomadura]|uniref:DUF397 domain-containing protein n=1 Tax=unclassified Actinomadura TaxID=2626254 RepID=UPI0011EBBDF8|nr:DUF397 domain-containing protein [Actinomadura sp. K4S16]